MRTARRRTALHTFWQEYRRRISGLVGLAILGTLITLALSAPLLSSTRDLDPTTTLQNPSLASPRSGFPLGTDELGRSISSILLWGSRTSLAVGLIAATFSMVIGAVVGISSGYFRGWVDAVLTRIEEWFLIVPTLPLALVLVAVLGGTLKTIIIVIGLTSWAGTARLIRAQTLTVRERTYVERSRALGSGNWHIVSRHVLPNVMPIILANLTLTVPVAILSEATLSFLGIGDFSRESWGKTLEAANAASAVKLGAWWYFLPVGLLITIVAIAFTLVGNALEAVSNPKLRDR